MIRPGLVEIRMRILCQFYQWRISCPIKYRAINNNIVCFYVDIKPDQPMNKFHNEIRDMNDLSNELREFEEID